MSRSMVDRRTAILAVLALLFILIGLAMALLPLEWSEERCDAEPDGGNGSIELLLALIPLGLGIAIGVLAALRWRSRSRASASVEVAGGQS